MSNHSVKLRTVEHPDFAMILYIEPAEHTQDLSHPLHKPIILILTRSLTQRLVTGRRYVA